MGFRSSHFVPMVVTAFLDMYYHESNELLAATVITNLVSAVPVFARILSIDCGVFCSWWCHFTAFFSLHFALPFILLGLSYSIYSLYICGFF